MPPRRALPAAPRAPELDDVSQLVHAAGATPLAGVEELLRTRGLTLGNPPRDASVAEWLGRGAPGAPDAWLDPVDHLVAGYAVELPNGGALVIRPCPRRAVGPDLFALFFGSEGRAGRIHSVWLRARGRRAEPLETPIDRDPAIGSDESRWLERAVTAAASLP